MQNKWRQKKKIPFKHKMQMESRQMAYKRIVKTHIMEKSYKIWIYMRSSA